MISSGDTSSIATVGYFDVWPSDDRRDYNGAWSVYPLFKNSDIILVNGIEQGLFVLRATNLNADAGGDGGDATTSPPPPSPSPPPPPPASPKPSNGKGNNKGK